MENGDCSLNKKLTSALSSRDRRLIRRRLPDPLPTTTTTTSTIFSSSPSNDLNRKTALVNNDGSTKTTENNPVDTPLIDFTSNDYLSLTTSSRLRDLFLQKLHAAPDILGSGGSRLLVNGQAHDAFERRMEAFFDPPTHHGLEEIHHTFPGVGVHRTPERNTKALLFNSGFDANVGFFSCIPQPGDAIVYDEYIHASVHDGMRASRIPSSHQTSFKHNSAQDLRRVLLNLRSTDVKFRTGESSVFVSVESLYSMDGTLSPLLDIVRILDEVFPGKRNAWLVVDEAHATGLYGEQGRGRVVQLGLHRSERVLARLHTFGKALGASGAVIITTELVRDYLLNYARPLIYTTALSYANVVAADASFDLLEDGTADKLSRLLFDLSTHLIATLTPYLNNIPKHILALPSHLLCSPITTPEPLITESSLLTPALHPEIEVDPSPPSHTPIIPLLTAHPRPLAAFLRERGMNARPITWPTVPKGKGRVRVCLHAGLGAGERGRGRSEVDKLVGACVEWALREKQREEDAREREGLRTDTVKSKM